MKIKLVARLSGVFVALACSSDPITTNDNCPGNLIITPGNVDLQVGDSVRLVARAEPCVDSADERYLWLAEDTRVATALQRSDSTAMIVGRAAGSTVLRVRSVDDLLQLSVAVVVR